MLELSIRYSLRDSRRFREVNIGWKFVKNKKKKALFKGKRNIFLKKYRIYYSAFDLDNILIRRQGRHMERCVRNFMIVVYKKKKKKSYQQFNSLDKVRSFIKKLLIQINNDSSLYYMNYTKCNKYNFCLHIN